MRHGEREANRAAAETCSTETLLDILADPITSEQGREICREVLTVRGVQW